MRQSFATPAWGILLFLLLTLSACNTSYRLTTVTGSKTETNSTWDNTPNVEAQAVVVTYKNRIDSIMSPIVGKSAIDMRAHRPGSLLSNLIADVLRESSSKYLGTPADMAIMNIGGLRSSLSKGDITYGDIFEILPFENSLCLLTMKGSDVRELMKNIISVRGEGISNVQLMVSKDNKIISCTIGGKPLDDNRMYKVATIDYLAEGNDNLYALVKAVEKECRPELTIRTIFLEYIQDLTRKGQEVTASAENRIIIEK